MYDSELSRVWKDHLGKLLELLFPSHCVACHRMATGSRREVGLCVSCRGRIRPVPRAACTQCAMPLHAAHLPRDGVCLRCLNTPAPFDRLIAMWSYEPPVDSVLKALKFSARLDLARPLAEKLASRLGEDAVCGDVVAPVPLHWRRRLARGYDQADELGRIVASRLGVRFARLLRRHRPTKAQSSLPKTRRTANLRSAFRLRKGVALRNQRVVLIDDIVTSGATISAAARCLDRAGARSVIAAVIARTPAPGESLANPSRHMITQVPTCL
ncbi:MAG: ComF family protein [Acidobacteriota bacterium]|nr:ComF family protein [Acidobacteriota bacterium]